MSTLQNLNLYLTERLTLAAQEIFKAVEDVFLEYVEELSRSSKEIELLKWRLQLTEDRVDTDTQTSIPEFRTQSFCEEWRDTEMQKKLEVYTQHEEDEAPACSASASLSQCSDDYQDQVPCNDTQIEYYSESSFPFINQEFRIKDEPGTEIEINCMKSNENISSDWSKEPMNVKQNKKIISQISFQGLELQPFKPSSISQEMLTHHMIDLGKRGESKLQTQQRRNQSKSDGENENKSTRAEVQHLQQEKEHQKPQSVNFLLDVYSADAHQEAECSVSQQRHDKNPGDQNSVRESSCCICLKRFRSPHTLKIHMRIHSGEKPFSCCFCGKNFRQSNHMKTHIRIHTGERPHICGICGKSFSDSSAHVRHYKKCSLISR